MSRSTAGKISVALLSAASVFSQTCPDTPPAANFARTTLIASSVLNQPVEMAVAKDGRVFVAERGGVIRLYNPQTQQASVAATLDIYLYTASNNDFGGVLGLAVGPAFASDNWLYVYYAPRSLWNGITTNSAGRLTYRLSRFQVVSNQLVLSSEQIFLEVPSIAETHNAGSMHFGKNGDLYLSTGDNNCAGCSNQYSPMDERPGYEFSDDQRTTANTNILNGKVLRIHPLTDSVNGKWYSIPSGNLFPVGTDSTRPEIYTMGHRNPYRIFPDPITGRLYIGEFGPAAGSSSARGPSGADQLKITDSAAFMGYPYFLKNNQPYCHWNYATGSCIAIQGQTSLNYDPARPINTSPNNTGKRILPPAKPAVLWEHDGSDADPVAGIKGCGMGGGPVYHYDPLLSSTVKFPPYFENKWVIFGIYGNSYNGFAWQPKLANIPAGPVAPITKVDTTPWYSQSSMRFSSGIQDIEFGEGDGALYILDYGGTQYSNNSNDGLYRITYNGCLPAVTSIASAQRLFPTRAAWVMPGQMLPLPMGARKVAAFDVSGKTAWEQALAPSQRSVRIPEALGAGLLRVRFY